ncbi:MAG: NADH-quinone oxidoreductase subunit J [Acidobacteria bacterium]|nr:NADH-quinone oxidoreductase subunit J [Acidobacteriota bacterium]
MTVVFFYLCAATALISALSVVLQRKTISSALSLVVCLGALALLYVQLEATFIAVVQVIIYAGAIMVLFLFVIMLLDPTSEKFAAPARRVGYAAVPLVYLLGVLIWRAAASYRPAFDGAGLGAPSGIAAIGIELFSNYLLPFEVTSILILVAVLGAIVLAKKKL